jgi:hypothetical protein
MGTCGVQVTPLARLAAPDVAQHGDLANRLCDHLAGKATVTSLHSVRLLPSTRYKATIESCHLQLSTRPTSTTFALGG